MGLIKIDTKIVGVESTKKKKVVEEKETILVTDVQIPDDAPARMKVLRAGGKKWYVTLVYLPASSEPFALFCTTNHPDTSAQTHDAVDKLIAIARDKGILEEHIASLEKKIERASNVEKLTRSISLLLRHKVLISNVVDVLDSIDNVIVGSFLFQIKKFLSQYIKEGQKAEGKKCSHCGSTAIVYSEGCTMCIDCGSSKCG